MKIEPKRELTFGDLITAASWGSGSGRKDSAIGDQRAPAGTSRAAIFFNFFRMNKTKWLVDLIKIGAGIALVAALTGCVGFVGGDGGGGEVVVPGPDLFLFGGDYDRGRDVHGYSQRGSSSRAAAHSGGGGGRGGRR